MYAKLALGNVRRSVRDYSIYFLTLTISVAMFYSFSSIGIQAQYFESDSAAAIQALGTIMPTLTLLLMLITGLLMIYANNYLIRRRKREFSLYQILGMRASGVSKILVLETAISTIVPAIVGIFLGILLSQIMVFISAALFHQKVTAFHFAVSVPSILYCFAGLLAMFIMMSIFNVRSINKNSLISMLQADRQNEAVPIRGALPTFIATLAGLAIMAYAYMRLVHDNLPFLAADANQQMPGFYLTTAIVFVGGIVFCYGVAGALLYIVQLIKPLYLKGLTAFTLRQTSSKLSTQSLSMATNAFFLFLAATIVSVGMSFGAQFNAIDYAAPYSSTISFTDTNDDVKYPTDVHFDLLQGLIDAGYVDSSAMSTPHASSYIFDQSDIEGGDSLLWSSLSKAAGIELPHYIKTNVEQGFEDYSSPRVIAQSSYNATRRLLGQSEIDLGDNHYLFAAQLNEAQDFLQKVQAKATKISLGGQELTPMSANVDTGASAAYCDGYAPISVAIIVPDKLVEGKIAHSAYLNLNEKSDSTANAIVEAMQNNSIDNQELQTAANGGISYKAYVVITKDAIENSAIITYGTMAYLAIYIGLTFVLACSVILAIQQLASCADASKSYNILYKLGATRAQVARSIFAQNALYFLLPLAIALSHTALVIHLMKPALNQLGSDTSYITICLALFILVYIAYFILTYISCRSIVMNSSMKTRRS